MSQKVQRLYLRSYGIYYLRIINPKAVQVATGKRETWLSLRTKCPRQAKILALRYALNVEQAKANMPSKKSPLGLSVNPLKITTPDGFVVDFDHTNPVETTAAKAFIAEHSPPEITQAQRHAWQAADLAKLRDEEAARRLIEDQHYKIAEQYYKPKGRVFADLVKEYFTLFGTTVSPRTAKAYQTANTKFLEYIGQGVRVDEITTEKWREYRLFLASADHATGRKKISNRSIDNHTNAIGVVLKMHLGEMHPLRQQLLVKRKRSEEASCRERV